MVNINRSLGMEIYKKICNPRRFVYSPFSEKINIRDMQGCNYVIDKQGDRYYINGREIDCGDDVIEKICKIIIERDPLFTHSAP